MSFLNKIDSPADLKKIPTKHLPELADDLRKFIITSLSETGGHLAPSLGVVELTIALLYVYSPPRDKIIWDVGHQAYAYKIFTGRRDKFSTLRQHGGISGFCKRDESEYDAWGVGHASTSISAALGFATDRDLSEKNSNIIAVIGDGALTGGLAFEGMNNAGASGTEMLVILNDNAMSISRNVGALASYLTEIVASPIYQKIKKDIWHITGRAGEFGKHLRTIARKLEDSFKNLIVPGMLFEQLGFEYYGPIDGHNIDDLIRVLREIKDVQKPKLLHVLTTKGKGFKPAEKDATRYHGLGKFDPKTGKPHSGKVKPSYTDVFSNAMIELGARFDELVTITAAMETGTGLEKFHKVFPKRFFDVGIAEGHAIVFGAAMAAEGRRTVAAIYSSFIQRAYDPIIHDVALQKIPLIIAMDRAGIVGEDGPTHHGTFDISFLRPIPNIVIVAPKDGQELRDLLYSAVKGFSETWFIRYPRGIIPDSEPTGFKEIPFGEWEIIRTGDKNLLLLAVGSMVYPAIEAAEKLQRENISATVVNCRFIKPMDEKTLKKLLRTHKSVFTIEEGSLPGGFGEGVISFAKTMGFATKKIHAIGIKDDFIPFGKRDELLDICGLTSNGILCAIKEFLPK